MPLAPDQLGHHPHQQGVRGDPESGRDLDPRAGPGVALPVHGAAHHPQLGLGQPLGQQDPAYPLGDGDDAIVQSVLGRHQPARLRVVHPPGVNHRGPGQTGGDAAPDISPDAAVKMHQIRAGIADQPNQAPDHGDIRVPAHGQPMYLGEGGGGPGQITPGGAGQQIGVAAGGQPLQEIQDLLGPAIEAAPAFDVEDSQGATSSLSASSEIAPAFPTCRTSLSAIIT